MFFKENFSIAIEDIQNHGRNKPDYQQNNINKAYERRDGKTFLSSNLLRNQVDGLKDLFEDGRGFSLFEIKDGFTLKGILGFL